MANSTFEEVMSLLSSLCAHFPTFDFIARLAFGNFLDQGAQQENESKLQAN